MAVDISKMFKATVKALRMSLSDGSDTSEILNEQLFKNSKNKVQKRPAAGIDAKQIVQNITLLKKFLNDNKKIYIQPNYLVSDNVTDDLDWQSFEDEAENVIKKCSDAIRTQKENALRQVLTPQYREHLENVFFLLEKYLKEICQIFSEQKAIRVKRVLEKKNYSQLFSSDMLQVSSSNSSDFKSSSNKLSEKPSALYEEEEKDAKENNTFENSLSYQEQAELEKENILLFENLSIQSEEIMRIESEVIEVSRLTQLFTENIVSQLTTIESVQKAAIETNSNLVIGNENIKEAMKKNAALRLWILFIIAVLSFTLLFLDWYND